MIDKRPSLTLFCLLAGCFFAGPMAVAQPPRPVVINREYEYKAEYLYHFAALCEWETDRIVIGVLGPDRFGRQLQRIQRHSQNLPKRIVTRVFNDIDDFEPCQILFVSGRSGDAQAKERLRQALEKTKEQATLIFTEARDFAQAGDFARLGADVNFYIEKNLLRLLINREVADQAGVEIPPRLLNLKSVTTIPPREADR